MKKQYLLYISALVFIITGCKSLGNRAEDAEVFTYDNFVERTELTGEILDIKELVYPRRIRIIDSLFFVLDRKDEKFVSVFDLNNNYSYLGSFLSRGRGPEELLNTMNMNYSRDKKYIWLNDPNLRKIVIYDVGSIDSLNPDNTINANSVLNHEESIDKPILLSTGDIIASPIVSDNKFVFMDSTGKKTKIKGTFPKFFGLNSTHGQGRIFEYNYVVKSDESRIMVFNRYTDVIEVYDGQGDIIKFKQGPDIFAPVFQIESSGGGTYPHITEIDGETRMSYYEPIERDGIIWVLYGGYYGNNPVMYDKILTFDWDGNPLAVYDLPYDVRSFEVDPHNRVIYGLSKVEGDHKLVTYRY